MYPRAAGSDEPIGARRGSEEAVRRYGGPSQCKHLVVVLE